MGGGGRGGEARGVCGGEGGGGGVEKRGIDRVKWIWGVKHVDVAG